MRKLVSILALALFTTANIASADETGDGDYVELERDQAAPYSGFLFDRDSLAALMARQDKQKAQIVLDKDTECKKVQIDLNAQIAKKQAEIDINKELSDKLVALNKEELKLTQNKLERVSWLSPTLFVTGVAIGAALTVSILKIAVQTVK